MNVGLGVMINALSSDKSHEAYIKAVGRHVIKVSIDETIREDGAIVLDFFGGSRLVIWDNGRSCCESRYITTDDFLEGVRGKNLVKIEIKDTTSTEGSYGDEHEIQFLEIAFSDGDTLTFCTHNEHNGYYGGFYLKMEYEDVVG